MREFSLAFKLSALRLKRVSLFAAFGAVLLFCVLVALLERQAGPGAADRTLTGAAFGLALPLSAWAIMRRTCLHGNFQSSFGELARHGADRRRLAMGQLATAGIVCMLLGTLLGCLTVLAARGLQDPVAARDAWSSASVGALAGAAYACWFALGSSFGERGGGGMAFLLLDWTLGSSDSALALPLPRGHILNLLGARGPLNLEQTSSAGLLIALTFFLLALAIYRIPR